jgi:hypothetical protein
LFSLTFLFLSHKWRGKWKKGDGENIQDTRNKNQTKFLAGVKDFKV